LEEWKETLKMPDLKCRDGDLNGYGCISSQFVDSMLFKVYGSNPPVGNSQWFGKIARFRYDLELPNGTTVTEDQIRAAIAAGLITNCTVSNVTYTPDPFDPTIAYAQGEVEIVADPASPIPSSPAGQPYKFKHTLAQVWRLTETKFT
jgi:hypothetical protein